eukprot:1184389-Prorocentrum_minimum.AAC.3
MAGRGRCRRFCPAIDSGDSISGWCSISVLSVPESLVDQSRMRTADRIPADRTADRSISNLGNNGHNIKILISIWVMF